MLGAPHAGSAGLRRKRLRYRCRVPLIFHWGGPRHGHIDDVPAEQVASSLLVYDGPQWIGVYEPVQPPQLHGTPKGLAEVWIVRE